MISAGPISSLPISAQPEAVTPAADVPRATGGWLSEEQVKAWRKRSAELARERAIAKAQRERELKAMREGLDLSYLVATGQWVPPEEAAPEPEPPLWTAPPVPENVGALTDAFMAQAAEEDDDEDMLLLSW